MKQHSTMPPYRGHKNKWVAGLLSFLIPGTGYFYLGLMAKGIAVMMLMALDIAAIVYAAIELHNPLLIILLSLLLPIIYFYNLFDAIQSTDMVNARREMYIEGAGQQIPPFDGEVHGPAPHPPVRQPAPSGFPAPLNTAGVIVLAAIVIVILVGTGIGSSSWVWHATGTKAGAVVLIVAGIVLWIWDSRQKRGGNG